MATIIDFNSSIWGDGWFRKLSPREKLLFIYLWTNSHKNMIAMYEIEIDQIAFEMKISEAEVLKAINNLTPKVMFDPDTQMIWVVNHVRHQFMRTDNISPKIVTGIKKCLIAAKGHQFVTSFCKSYKSLDLQDFIKGYPYPIDTVSIGYEEGTSEGGGGGEEKGKSNKKPAFELPDWLDKDAWKHFLEMRNKAKAPMTDYAKQKMIKKLEKFKDEGQPIKEVLDKSTYNCWKDVYRLTDEGNDSSTKADKNKELQRLIKEYEKEHAFNPDPYRVNLLERQIYKLGGTPPEIN